MRIQMNLSSHLGIVFSHTWNYCLHRTFCWIWPYGFQFALH